MSSMFNYATNFNQDISGWNVSNVVDMTSMFNVATIFNQDIGNWNTSKVTSMSYMFSDSPNFNQNIGNWDTSNVTNMEAMFYCAVSFNQDISNWDTSNVTNMIGLFFGASCFNQNIGNWNFSSLTTDDGLVSAFMLTGLSTATYSQFLIDLSHNFTLPHGILVSMITCYKYNDSTINDACDYLRNVKGLNFTDYGSIDHGTIIPDQTIPIYSLDTSLNIPRSQRYTIITDSGGISGNYKNNENYNMTVTFVNGVSLKINQIIHADNDQLKIYNTDASGTMLYSSGNDICNNIIDLTDLSQICITFTSSEFITLDGFVILIEIIPLPVNNICFIGSTPVNTDQGIISINKLSNKNSINGIKIKHITESLTNKSHLVLLKKNSLSDNVPSQDTYMTMNHKVLYNGKMVVAKDLIGKQLVPYNGEILYNILLEEYSHVLVNNLTVESLYPGNSVAKLYIDIKK